MEKTHQKTGVGLEAMMWPAVSDNMDNWFCSVDTFIVIIWGVEHQDVSVEQG